MAHRALSVRFPWTTTLLLLPTSPRRCMRPLPGAMPRLRRSRCKPGVLGGGISEAHHSAARPAFGAASSGGDHGGAASGSSGSSQPFNQRPASTYLTLARRCLRPLAVKTNVWLMLLSQVAAS